MGLLKKLKSVFGSGGDEQSGSSSDAEVTVEYAPDAESEHAVKGTDEADVSEGAEVDEAARTAQGEDPVDADGSAETDESGAETETVSDEDEATTAAGEDGDTPENPAVDSVKGIGPTYSDRLGAAGIETVDDLAGADAEAVADAAKVSVSRAENWIERARSRT